jgi:hypothetical protein
MKGATLCRSGELLVEGERAAIDEATRTATFVVATEAPVAMWPGAPGEVLRMKGADLREYKRNPVVVDAHRIDVKSILGVARIRVEGRQLLADVTYDQTPEGEGAWLRVKSGSLRAASIRYEIDPKKTVRLLEGETDGKGEDQVTGPAFVCRGWKLVEVTMCAVGRDRDALRRSYEHITSGARRREERSMADENEGAPEDGGQVVTKEELEAARKARIAQHRSKERLALHEEIRSMAPADMKDVAEQCVLEGLDVDAARKRMLEERAKKAAPVGTPEPAPAPGQRAAGAATTAGSATGAAPKVELTKENVKRALTGLRS